MRRREFIAGLVGAAVWPLAARAQEAGKTYRVGWLNPVPIQRWGDGNFDRLPAMAAELVGLNVDVIISGNTTGLFALQKLTQAIPIVMLGPGDPLALA
jgi:putative ABC transport system substrate-binding protein